MVRVRFAPSPTGNMHLGNLRTAIFNWLFARTNNGQFFIRIEDTDKQRSEKKFEDGIFNILNWMKLDYDEFLLGNQVFRQSERHDIYKKIAQDLVEKQLAYYCNCLALEESSAPNIKCQCREIMDNKVGAIKFKTPLNDNIISFNDIVFNVLERKYCDIEDFTLLRSDGTATYMLAVVVDDIEMQITHIIRGSDHMTNTFKQLMLYQALNKQQPFFAHLPLIKGEDGKKLSKRNADTNIDSYIQKGFIPEAMFSILLRLGWGYKNEEIIDRNRALELFKLEDIRTSPTLFDINKFASFNSFYLKKYYTTDDVKKFIFQQYHINLDTYVDILFTELLPRSKTLNDFYQHLSFIYDHKINLELKELINYQLLKQLKVIIEQKAKTINLSYPQGTIIHKFYTLCHKLCYKKTKILLTQEEWQELITQNHLLHEFSIKEIYANLRYVVFSSQYSPDLLKCLTVLDIQEVLNRIKMYSTQKSLLFFNILRACRL